MNHSQEPSRAESGTSSNRGAPGDELVAFLYADATGLARGRAVPEAGLERRLRTGVGWVPADQAITVFGPLADPNPWGSRGDLRLWPDPQTKTRVDIWPDVPPLHFYLCDALTVDGEPWDACVRALLKRALSRLEAEAGLMLVAAFEHEFVLMEKAREPAPAFSMEALRQAAPLGEHLVAALRQAGRELETFLPEYGAGQYELTCTPRDGLAAADEASIVRELVRECARRLGSRASFAPIVDPAGSGNGLHIHLSLRDRDGAPASFDPDRPGQLSEVAARFAAGVLRHAAAICAVAAPSATSYIRLAPHRWSAGYACLGAGNRETLLRIPGRNPLADADPAEQVRLEFRAADGSCSPHFTLALIVLAGLEGVSAKLEPAAVVSGDPEALAPAELAALQSLPRSLEEALAAFEVDPLFRAELADDLHAGYCALKRKEVEVLEGFDLTEVCARYAGVF